MSRTIFAVLLLVASHGFVCAEALKSLPATAKPLLDAYRGCVVDRAKSFAGSPDSTERLIKEAMGACATAKRALSEALGRGGFDSADVNAALGDVDQQVFQAASQAVEEERASH
jgi:hypothetical protein